MNAVLVDAGPLVAIFHRTDNDHGACVETLRQIHQPLVTTWAPFTEAMYLLSFSSLAQDALLSMVERGALRILPMTAEDVPALRELMQKYGDLPMDFADATLVRIAHRESIGRVFTLDRRDFAVYRTSRGRSFKLLP